MDVETIHLAVRVVAFLCGAAAVWKSIFAAFEGDYARAAFFMAFAAAVRP